MARVVSEFCLSNVCDVQKRLNRSKYTERRGDTCGVRVRTQGTCIVLDGTPIPLQRGRGEVGKMLPVVKIQSAFVELLWPFFIR